VIRKTIWGAAILMSLPLSLLVALPPASAEGTKPAELRPVLLVVDVQNSWLPAMDDSDRASAPAKINEAISLFRQYGYPVVAVYHSDPKGGPPPGTDLFRFPEWVAITDDDPVIVKAHPSAFTKTDLDSVLHATGRNAVFLCGLSAVGCVLATYFGADDRGYMAFMVEGALLSHDSSYTAVIEDICDSVSLRELATLLGGQR